MCSFARHGTINFTNCRQDTHMKIIYILYASEQSERGKFFTFLHSKPAISVIIFVCNLFVQLFCRYNMTFNREILGGGMIIQAIPPPKILGWGIYPPHPPPPPPGIDTHGWGELNKIIYLPTKNNNKGPASSGVLDSL